MLIFGNFNLASISVVGASLEARTTCRALFLLVLLLGCSGKILANNSFYLSVASQILNQRKLEQLSNNIANTASPAFQEDHFVIGAETINTLPTVFFPRIIKQFRKKDLGEIVITNNKLDIVLLGEYYFKVMTEDGIKYTADGRMLVNDRNILVNHYGYSYLDTNNNEIQIIGSVDNLTFAENGSIFVNGENIAQIAVVELSDDLLIKQGNNLYLSSEEGVNIENFSLVIGGYRKSNVNSFESMAKLSAMQTDIYIANNNISDITKLTSNMINKFSIK